MSSWFYHFVNTFSLTESTVLKLGFLLVLASIGISLLRLIICLYYRGQLLLFSWQTKKSLTKEDLIKIKNGMVGKISHEFMDAGEKGVAHIDTRAIAQKHINQLSLLGWSYASIENFSNDAERAILVAGLILALLSPQLAGVGLMSIALFALVKIFGSLFNPGQAREKLFHEAICFINREVGRYYVSDATSAVNLLRIEMKKIIDELSQSVSLSIEQLATEYKSQTKQVFFDMIEILDKTMTCLRNMPAMFETVMNSQSENTAAIKQVLQQTSEQVVSQTNALAEQNQIIEKQLSHFTHMGQVALESSRQLSLHNQTLENQLDFIKQNQDILANSLHQYEVALKNITTQLGDALGKMLDYHLQESYQQLIAGLQENIHQVLAANQNMTNRLQDLFNEMQTQSRTETSAILHLQEQMDMQFEQFKNSQQTKNN